jgi:hypothetical protein
MPMHWLFALLFAGTGTINIATQGLEAIELSATPTVEPLIEEGTIEQFT